MTPKLRKELKEKWLQYIKDHPKWYRTFNTSHHYIRCRYASKFWLKEIDRIISEVNKLK
jgi:hypothetical protein